jgi:hypothetical protein
VVRHDDTVHEYTDVRYTHTGAGLIIETGDGQLFLSAFDVAGVQAYRHADEQRAMAPDTGEPPADDQDVLAAYECPAGGLCDCRHQPSTQGRSPRCPRCGCSCPLPDPGDALGDPDACPCCHYTGPA